MALKLKTKRTTEFVEYREDNDDLKSEVLAKFEIQCLTPSESMELLKKYNRDKFIEKPGAKGKKKEYERIQDPDFISLTHEKIKKIIVGWENVLDEKGKEIPCTDENKIIVYELNPDVIDYVIEKADSFGRKIEEVEEEEIKN